MFIYRSLNLTKSVNKLRGNINIRNYSTKDIDHNLSQRIPIAITVVETDRTYTFASILDASNNIGVNRRSLGRFAESNDLVYSPTLEMVIKVTKLHDEKGVKYVSPSIDQIRSENVEAIVKDNPLKISATIVPVSIKRCDTNEIIVYSSMRQASFFTGISSIAIRKALTKKEKTGESTSFFSKNFNADVIIPYSENRTEQPCNT